MLDFKLYFMKSSYKKIIENALFRLYKPLCVRIEKYRAYKLWKDGIKQCDELNEKLKVRVYLFWDSSHSCWAPLTYEPNKLHYPSIRELLRLGKMKVTIYLQTFSKPQINAITIPGQRTVQRV